MPILSPKPVQGGVMLYKIILCCLVTVSLFSIEQVYLKTPDLFKENIIGTVSGIRPFRSSGVRIEAEYIGDKCIVHNYGYGGSGFTLCFGGAKEVLDILDHHISSSKTVAVLGAGVIGLATAYDLLAQGYEVHLYASEWTPHLTSNIAAGIWTPLLFPKNLSEEKKQFHLKLQNNAEKRFMKSVVESPEFSGVRLINCYSFLAQNVQESERTKEREEVIACFDNGITKKGRKIVEIAIEGQLFLDDLFLKVKEKGAILTQCKFESLEDLVKLEEPLIINCTSMGAISLFNDESFLPVRGQLVYFKPQPEIDYLYSHQIDNAPDDSAQFFVSIYPWSDRIILGDVYELDEEEPIVVPEIIDKIIENGRKNFSGL